MLGGRWLVWLVAAHVVLGVVSVALASVEIQTPVGLPRLLVVPAFATTFSQVSLLGFWALFSTSAWWKRLLGWGVGTAYLEAALDIAFKSECLFMPFATMALTVISLLVVRGFGFRLSRRTGDVDSSRHEPASFQFSIRGLMVLTAAVALLSGVARAIRGSNGGPGFEPITVVWPVCAVAVSLLSLRALSAIDRPIRRGLPAFTVSPLLGAFVAQTFGANGDGWVYIILIMLLYPMLLVGSLFVVRASGFLLVPRTPPVAEAAAAITSQAGSFHHPV